VQLFLARHGQTDWNATHRLQGQANRPLTTLGLAQAQALRDFLVAQPIQAIYASPLQRTLTTAAPLAAALGLEVQARAAMLEIDYGILEGHTQESVAGTDLEELWLARKRNPLAFDAPGAETYATLRDRVRPFADELRQRHAAETIAVIGHRASNRALLALLLDRPLSAVVTLKQKNADVLEICPQGDPELQTHRIRQGTRTGDATKTGGNS
jgi:probable phosphoglycerate mutase